MITLLTLSISACKTEISDNNNDKKPRGYRRSIQAGTLDGTINGFGWTFKSGRVTTSTFDNNKLSFDFWETYEADPCSVFISSSNRSILGSFPLKRGEYPFSLSQNVTFAFEEQDGSYLNLFVTDGRLIIDDIDGSTLRGRMVANYDSDNSVSGEFELAICTQ